MVIYSSNLIISTALLSAKNYIFIGGIVTSAFLKSLQGSWGW